MKFTNLRSAVTDLRKPERQPQTTDEATHNQGLQKQLRMKIDELQIGIKSGVLSHADLHHELLTGGIDEDQLTELLKVLDDEEDEEPDLSTRSEQDCPCCQEHLDLTEEVFLLEVTEAARDDAGEPISSPILAADNDYQYLPLFLHFMCWEECMEVIKQEIEFQPAQTLDDEIFRCLLCSSSIAPFEPYINATFGELRYSQKSPEGESTQRFERLSKAKQVCIACMVYVIPDSLDDWEDLLDNLPSGEEEEDEHES